MRPVNFPRSNGTLMGGPGANYGTENDVIDLPVCREPIGRTITSCWRPSFWQRIQLLFGARVWLVVLTERSHPPVALEVYR